MYDTNGNFVGGSNVDVNTAISHWYKFAGKSYHLGAPAPALCPAWDSERGLEHLWIVIWLTRVLLILFHYIAITEHMVVQQEQIHSIKEVVDATYNMYHKPIWITEFAVSGWGYSNASNRKQIEAFLKTAIEGLNKRSYVERYSWFSFNTTDNSNGASALWTNSTGKLTDLGNIYVNNGNPTELAAQGSAS